MTRRGSGQALPKRTGRPRKKCATAQTNKGDRQENGACINSKIGGGTQEPTTQKRKARVEQECLKKTSGGTPGGAVRGNSPELYSTTLGLAPADRNQTVVITLV